MNKRIVSVICPAVFGCALLVSGCGGRLTSDSQSLDAGKVLVHDLGLVGTQFNAVRGEIEFAGRGNPSGIDAAMFEMFYRRDPMKDGETIPVNVGFTPTGLGPRFAEYSPSLLSGEPSTGSFPLRLSGVGVGYFEWPGNSITGAATEKGHDFGEVCVTRSLNWTYTVTNKTANPVAVASYFMGGGSPAISVHPRALTIPARSSLNMTIRFDPPAAQTYDATVVLYTPHPWKREVGVWVRGKGKDC